MTSFYRTLLLDRQDEQEDQSFAPVDEGFQEEDCEEALEPRMAPEIIEKALAALLEALDEKKATDVTVIDLKNKVPHMDYMVVATGRSSVHVRSTLLYLRTLLKQHYDVIAHRDANADFTWAVLDGDRIMVHLFEPVTRQTYNLEGLWGAKPKTSSSDSSERV